MPETAIDKSWYGTSKSAQWGVADSQLSNGQRWLSFFVLFAFGVSCVYQYQMVTPILTQIGEVFGMGLDNVGMIMSVFAITGLVLTYPATWIMQNIGIKVSLIATGVLSIVGNVISIAATGVAGFLAGRIIQGCAFAMIAVIGPNLMPRLFPRERQGFIMGIWSTWFCWGVLLATFVTPILYQAFDWSACFTVSTIVQIVLVVLLFVFFKMPLTPENALGVNGRGDSQSAGSKKNYVRSAVVIGFSFLAFEIVYMTFASFYPTYAQNVQGLGIADAAMPGFWSTIFMTPTSILIGWLADKYSRSKEILIAGYVVLALVSGFIMWSNTQNIGMMWVSTALYGFISVAAIPVCTRSLITVEAQTPKATDWALTSMTICTSIGGFAAGFFGTLVSASSWAVGGYVMAACCVIGIFVIAFCKGDHAIRKEQGLLGE